MHACLAWSKRYHFSQAKWMQMTCDMTTVVRMDCLSMMDVSDVTIARRPFMITFRRFFVHEKDHFREVFVCLWEIFICYFWTIDISKKMPSFLTTEKNLWNLSIFHTQKWNVNLELRSNVSDFQKKNFFHKKTYLFSLFFRCSNRSGVLRASVFNTYWIPSRRFAYLFYSKPKLLFNLDFNQKFTENYFPKKKNWKWIWTKFV